MTYELFFLLLFLGCFVGVVSGLLGIGGGLIVVPALVYLLPAVIGSAANIMSIALATSLATVIITSGSSARNHFKFGNVDFFAIKWLLPGVISGGFFGAFIAEWIPSNYLPQVFGWIVLLLSIQMFLSIKVTKQYPMPNKFITMLSGSCIGIVSSLAGIGGGSLTVPFLNRYGIEMRKAIGTSSVCGCILAIAGMLGFVFNSFDAENRLPYSLGYVYLPALLAISSTSMLTTKIGARLACELPTTKLKRVFAVFLMLIACKMLF